MNKAFIAEMVFLEALVVSNKVLLGVTPVFPGAKQIMGASVERPLKGD